MAYLKKKFSQLETALESWGQLIDWPYSDIVRDATIQRYEFTEEAVECNSPKSCFREARLPLKLSEKEVELCLRMTEDRNLSVHTYSKKMAESLYKKTKAYYKISKKICEAIEQRL